MSTITKELAKLFRKITNSEIDAEGNAHVVLSPADSLLINNARIALASLEAEAVACIDRANLDYLESGADADVWPASGAGSDDVLLYAAPQLPQPEVLSVPDGVLKSLLPDVEKSEFWFEHNGKIFFEGVRFNNAVFEACRAAMIQAGNFRENQNPSTNNCREISETSTNEHVRHEYRASDEQVVMREYRTNHSVWIQCSKQAYERRKAQGYEVRELYERHQAGNSPAKCSLREGIEAIRNSGIPVDVDRIQSECAAGNSPATPDCWCRTCRPVTMSDMRFVVCPDCDNKRCPHANDHRNACTGSNEPGQIGSAYPAAPQQEVK